MTSSLSPRTNLRAVPAVGSTENNDTGNSSSNESFTGENSVQPSYTLIEKLHHRLRDPDLVPRFEDSRKNESNNALEIAARLIRPRWRLTLSTNEGNSDVPLLVTSFQSGGRSSLGNAEAKFQDKIEDNWNPDGAEINIAPNPDFLNNLPERNYLNLRIEQMTMFCDEQCKSCSEILRDLMQNSPKSARNIPNYEVKVKLKKEKHMMQIFQSRMEKGLAACPDHRGLRVVNEEWKEWLQSRMGDDGGSCDAVTLQNSANMHPQRSSTQNGKNGIHTITHMESAIEVRKGALGRADAAMRDALAERSFLMDGSRNNDDNVGGYDFLPSQDDVAAAISGNYSNGGHKNEQRDGSRERSGRKGEGKRKSRRKSRKKKSNRSSKYYKDDSSDGGSDDASHGDSSKSDIESNGGDYDSRSERRKQRHSHKHRKRSSRRKHRRSYEKRKKDRKHRGHSSSGQSDHSSHDDAYPEDDRGVGQNKERNHSSDIG